VDATATIRAIEPRPASVEMSFEPPAGLRRYLVEKGSVAVDGVSLTVAGVEDGTFSVALIPHTLRATTLGSKSAGDVVNLEVDILAKYVESLMEGRSGGVAARVGPDSGAPEAATPPKKKGGRA
jgi:riboflavin synthase